MNAPRIIELAIARVLVEHAELGGSTVVRPWRSLAAMGGTNHDRALPCVDIRFSPALHNEGQATQTCAGEIAVMTHGADDADHTQIAEMEESVRDTLERLYDQAKAGTVTGAEYATFMASATEESDGQFLCGGFTFDGGAAPFDDDDVNAISISFSAHFARSGG